MKFRFSIYFSKLEYMMLDVCVVSFGGVGCTALMKVLSQYLRVNNINDKDGLKHKRSPRLGAYQTKKVIYVYNNPINAILSLYRRNFQRSQYKKLTGKTAPPLMTLWRYAYSGRDLFQLENHFDNWKRGSTKFPILMVNGATMYQPKNMKKIIEFLGVNIPISRFQKKSRQSNYKMLHIGIRKALENTYGNLMRKMKNTGDVYLVPKVI